MNKTQIFKLLDKHDYRVVVVPTNGGCVAMFPERNESPFLQFRSLHCSFESNTLVIEMKDADGESINNATIPCPSYAMRAIPLYYVIYWCKIIGYDFEAVKFLYQDTELTDKQFLAQFKCEFQQPGDQVKEHALIQLCSQAVQLGFSSPNFEQAANNMAIGDGFEIVKQIFTQPLEA